MRGSLVCECEAPIIALIAMPRSKHLSRATTWLMVNGGVSAIALAVTFVERAILSGTQSEVLAAVGS